MCWVFFFYGRGTCLIYKLLMKRVSSWLIQMCVSRVSSWLIQIYISLWLDQMCDSFVSDKTCQFAVCCGVLHYLRCERGKSSGTHMNGSCHTYEWVTPHVWMCHVTTPLHVSFHGWNVTCQWNVSYHTYELAMLYVCMSNFEGINDVLMSHVARVNASCYTYACAWCHSHRWVVSHI